MTIPYSYTPYDIIYNMQSNIEAKHGSKMSVESRRSMLSGCQSLGRPSWEGRDPSLSHKQSLIYVMSIESEKKSDIYEKLLSSDSKPQRHNNPFGSGMENNTHLQEHPEQRRKSDIRYTSLLHTCVCYFEGGGKCEGNQCPCYLAESQMCQKGLCCPACMEAKFNLLRSQEEEPQCYCKRPNCKVCGQKAKRNPQQQLGNDVYKGEESKFCTCKKTKCIKKYCSCFATGNKCGTLCLCEDCENCVKYEGMDVQEGYNQNGDDYPSLDLPEGMDFEPVDFSTTNY